MKKRSQKSTLFVALEVRTMHQEVLKTFIDKCSQFGYTNLRIIDYNTNETLVEVTNIVQKEKNDKNL